jgi:hypothetical protein
MVGEYVVAGAALLWVWPAAVDAGPPGTGRVRAVLDHAVRIG